MTATNQRSFQKLAAGMAILSAPVAYIGEYFGFTAINFDPTIFSDPSALVSLGPESAALFRWDWTFAMFGFYLLVVPAILVLWAWQKPRNPMGVTLLTLGGLAYVFLGALGSAINAVLWPELIAEYARAGPEHQAVIETVFGAVATGVVSGMWGLFGRTVSAVWWLGIGALLRSERRALGYATMVVGVFASVAAVGEFALQPTLINVGTTGVLFLAPIWALWLGVSLWRRPAHLEKTGESGTAPKEAGASG